MRIVGEKLDWTKKQEVSYCIPLWLRDEQVKVNSARIKGRIEEGAERPDPIALVSFGPSLADTWERLRDFKYIMTCSGAHRFLVERGIIPTHHVEVDPRAHKVDLMGPPQEGVQYLPSSSCHPALFEHLAGYDVRLWHVFVTEEEAFRALPPGEWALTGGSSVGLRTMVLASFLGFRDCHIFGMDGCIRPDGTTHAMAHPNGPTNVSEVEYEGKTYLSTPSMLEVARTTFYEIDQLPGVRATFYGDGLVQEMAKKWTPKPAAERKQKVIAVRKPELISPEYRALNARLHEDNLAYGVGGGRHAHVVRKLCESLGTQSVLDYGSGKGYLAKALEWPIWEYDPAIPGKDVSPRPADIVVCADVLEHIEPDKLMPVLDDLRRVTRKVGFFVIHTGASSKSLADGRNAHLIQQPREWWEERVRRFFHIGKIIETPPLLQFVAAPVELKFKKKKREELTEEDYLRASEVPA